MMDHDMAAELLDRLRELPHAAAALHGVAPEPGVHVVGGAVRDVLLGRHPVEIDLVVEGSAEEVARRVARRMGGDVRVHERFGTATVRTRETTFDLASTRRERYSRPGALPEVSLGATLAEDLQRRDFTVNAVAVSAHDGHVTPHPSALADISDGTLRALHPESFRDDPTRLLRLCRYAARLALAVEPGTAVHVEQAVAGEWLQAVSGDRIGRELRLLAAEPQPAALLALAGHGLGPQALHPAFAVDATRITEALALCPPDGRADLVALAATLVQVPADALARRLDELGFERRERELVVAAATRGPALAVSLGAGPGIELWEVLARESPETVAIAAALAADPVAERVARRWLDDLRHLDTVLSGHDLEAAGLRGPAVGRGLRAARAAVLEGRAPDFERQLAAALAAGRGR